MKTSPLPHWIALLATTVAFSGAVFAQTPPRPAGNGNFRLLSMVGSYGGVKYEATSKKVVPVVIAQTPSSYYPAPTNLSLAMYRELTPPPDSPPNTPPTRKAAVTIKLPAISDPTNPTPAWLVITLPEPANSATLLRAVAIPEDFTTHMAGTLRLINLSEKRAAFSISGVVHEVAAGASQIISVPAGKKFIQVQAAIDMGGRWAHAWKEEFRVNAQLRGYLIMSNYMDDPEYSPIPQPPPAMVRAFFEFGPRADTPSLAAK